MATVCLTYDFDAVSTWLWSYDSWDMPTRHSRGVYGADVGAPRLLDLHDEHDVPATWFVPGHTLDSFPEVSEEIHARGYSIQHHGWSHTGPAKYDTREDERADIQRGIESIEAVTGEAPTGYRSPAWDFSEHTLELLQELGFEWDSSQMGHDFRPYYVRENWAAPTDDSYDRGRETDIVELPVSWQRDDWPPLTFTWVDPYRVGYEDEDVLFKRWYDQFDWMYENVDDGVFILTMHPQVMGQTHRISRLEEFVQYLKTKPDVEFREMDAVAREYRG